MQPNMGLIKQNTTRGKGAKNMSKPEAVLLQINATLPGGSQVFNRCLLQVAHRCFLQVAPR